MMAKLWGQVAAVGGVPVARVYADAAHRRTLEARLNFA